MAHGARRLVVLGTGFGAFNPVKHLDRDYAVTVVSPRNHFRFTPLLPSTTVGTIEFRSIIEPIRHARKETAFLHAEAVEVQPGAKQVLFRGGGEHHLPCAGGHGAGAFPQGTERRAGAAAADHPYLRTGDSIPSH
jgi:NADH dehydrogenase FAD-containing subunit